MPRLIVYCWYAILLSGQIDLIYRRLFMSKGYALTNQPPVYAIHEHKHWLTAFTDFKTQFHNWYAVMRQIRRFCTANVHTNRTPTWRDMEKIKLLSLQDGGYHSGVEDTCLLGCYAVWTVKELPTFRRIALPSQFVLSSPLLVHHLLLHYTEHHSPTRAQLRISYYCQNKLRLYSTQYSPVRSANEDAVSAAR